MNRYKHSAELGWKSDSEGGVAEMIFGYGLPMEDLPDDMPPAIRNLVRRLNAVIPDLEELWWYLDKAVNDYEHSRPRLNGE